MGAVVGEVRIDTRDIYDLSDPDENGALYRLANRLHRRTRPETVAQQLLFRSGERVSARRIDDSERLLRGSGYLHDVVIRPVAVHDGIVDIEVITRDAWTLDPGFSVARSGGSNSARFYVNDKNLLGHGVSVGVSRSTNVDRSGTAFSFADKHAFGPWTGLEASFGRLADGRQWSVAVGRPFYSPAAPWAAGVSASHSDVLTSVYDKGERISSYRSRQDAVHGSLGFSRPGEGRWVQRYTAGFDHQANRYEVEAGQPPPPDFLPEDRSFSGPFVGYEVSDEIYEKVVNRDQLGRPEYFALGTKATAQLGRSAALLGATMDSWLLSASVSRGLHVLRSHSLFASASLATRVEDGGRRNQLISGSFRYFIPQRHDAVFAISGSADLYRHPDRPAPLQIGGDNGLRGYPLSFQSGERRFLLTVEQRVYTDWYPYRLFRLGGALFADAGRAWHGTGERTADERTLTDAGIGLRLQNPRSASGSVVHVDLAFPANARNEVKSFQVLFKSYAAF